MRSGEFKCMNNGLHRVNMLCLESYNVCIWEGFHVGLQKRKNIQPFCQRHELILGNALIHVAVFP